MTVIKSKIQTNYFIYPNAVAQSSLSLEAKGLIAYMSSKPSDWVFHKSVIQEECGIGKDKLSRLFKELEANGNLKYTQSYDKKGRFKSYETVFFVDPSNNPAFLPLTDYPVAVKPLAVNPQLQSKDINKVNINTNILSVITDGFDHWWNLYPVSRRKNKKGCFNKFKTKCKNMTEGEIESFVNEISADVLKRVSHVDDLKYMPMTEPYLNQERWEDSK